MGRQEWFGQHSVQMGLECTGSARSDHLTSTLRHQYHEPMITKASNAQTPASTHRWVACRQEDGYSTAQTKHLLSLRTGSQGTTLCSASGMGEGVWFANQTKPACKTCSDVAEQHAGIIIRPIGRR